MEVSRAKGNQLSLFIAIPVSLLFRWGQRKQPEDLSQNNSSIKDLGPRIATNEEKKSSLLIACRMASSRTRGKLPSPLGDHSLRWPTCPMKLTK
jgi:hypothetical protein